MTAASDPQLATYDGDEWLVGIATLPMYVTENGKAYQPSVIVWMDAATEMIIHTAIVSPHDALGAASSHLRGIVERPATGRLPVPGRIRVASPELADVLRRESLDRIEVVCAPVPELEAAIESLTERLAPNDEEPDLHYLGADATAAEIAAMFHAAARLYATRPWESVPSDTSLIGITSQPLGLRDAVISVIGQARQVYGVLLFASLDDFYQFVDASDRTSQGEPASYPCHLALTYARRSELGPTLRAEIAANRWKVAGARAYPVVLALDEDGAARNPTRNELLQMEAIAEALVGVLGVHKSELEAALDGGSVMELRDLVKTSGGEIEIEACAPVPGQRRDDALLDDDGDLDEDRVEAYRAAVLGGFAASPEARAEPAAQWSEVLVDYAASYFGKTVMALSVFELREIVFDVIPRKVSVEPTAAPAIVAGLRAFLTFLMREHPGGDTARSLASLDGNAAQRLARLLADSSIYGPAKAFLMSGRAAGFDMSTQAGCDAWTAHMREHDIRLPMGFPAAAAPRKTASAKSPPTRQANKAKRKAPRAARTKSPSR